MFWPDVLGSLNRLFLWCPVNLWLAGLCHPKPKAKMETLPWPDRRVETGKGDESKIGDAPFAGSGLSGLHQLRSRHKAALFEFSWRALAPGYHSPAPMPRSKLGKRATVSQV